MACPFSGGQKGDNIWRIGTIGIRAVIAEAAMTGHVLTRAVAVITAVVTMAVATATIAAEVPVTINTEKTIFGQGLRKIRKDPKGREIPVRTLQRTALSGLLSAETPLWRR